jgi:hypothetical protein
MKGMGFPKTLVFRKAALDAGYFAGSKSLCGRDLSQETPTSIPKLFLGNLKLPGNSQYNYLPGKEPVNFLPEKSELME